MAIVSPTLRIVYYDVTKVACTSMKRLLYEVETGHPHVVVAPLRGVRRRIAAALGRPVNGVPRLHAVDWLETVAFDPGAGPAAADGAAHYHRFAIVRDPIFRLRSAWKNKIHRTQLAARPREVAALATAGLSDDPDFGTLIDGFETYRQLATPVRVHTTPFSWHLGDDLGFFDSVHRLERPDTIVALLSERAGRPLSLPHANESGPEDRDAALTGDQIQRLREITAPDYALLGDLYDPEAAIAQLERKDWRPQAASPSVQPRRPTGSDP